MAYGLRYQGEFSSIADVDYTLHILQKDFTGTPSSIQMAAIPVLHSWDNDEVFIPVKGSSLQIKYLNSGSIPIQNFFSINDDEFMVKFYEGANLLFIGYLVQDDCIEPMLDYRHEVTLSATDNLGLLKGIDLKGIDLKERVLLIDLVKACLINTGLELDTYIYANLTETSYSASESCLKYTSVEGDTFLNNDTYEKCYSVLETVLAKFRMCLFQSLGRWNIVRWDELRLTQAIPCFIYDKDFTLTGAGTMPVFFLAGFQQLMYPETGLTKSVVRPYEFAKEKFSYKYPKYLLKNYDLQNLGALLRQYVSGVETIKEYVATDWEDSFGSPAVERFIRVAYDNVGTELYRNLVMRGSTFDSARSIQSKPFEASKGDKLTFSFRFKTNVSQAGPITIVFAVRLFDGINNRYVDELPLDNGTWQTGIGYNYLIPTGENTNEWHDVSIKSSQIPFDGKIYCYLAQATQNPQSSVKETIISDIRMNYEVFINDSTKIIGHTHKNLQNVTPKNNSDIEINIDDSPRNPIAGTLFKPTFTGLLQDRTRFWRRNTISESKLLGEIITHDTLQHKSVPRMKLEGSFRGLQQASQNVSMLNWVKYNELAGLNFIFGRLEIDYRNDKLSGTLFEINKDSEGEGSFIYEFNYLYDTK